MYLKIWGAVVVISVTLFTGCEMRNSAKPVVVVEEENVETQFFYNITSNDSERKPKEIDLGNGLKVHQCGCYALKIKEYNRLYEWDGETVEGVQVFNHPDFDELVLTDNQNFISVYDPTEEVTFSVVDDGLQALRFPDYSAYWYPNGDITLSIVGDDDTHKLMENWVIIEDEQLALSAEEVIRLANKYTTWLALRGFQLGR